MEVTADKEAFWPMKQNGKFSMGQSNMSCTMARLLQLGSIDTEVILPWFSHNCHNPCWKWIVECMKPGKVYKNWFVPWGYSYPNLKEQKLICTSVLFPISLLLNALKTEDKPKGEVAYFLWDHPQNLHQGLLAVNFLSSSMFILM